MLQNRLLLDFLLTRAQRRVTMKRWMSWSHRSWCLMLLLAPQLLLPAVRNKPRKWNLSQTPQNQNPCRTVQNPAQPQRSVWESSLQPLLSSDKGVNALLTVMLRAPPGCLKKIETKPREKLQEYIEKASDAHVCV